MRIKTVTHALSTAHDDAKASRNANLYSYVAVRQVQVHERRRKQIKYVIFELFFATCR